MCRIAGIINPYIAAEEIAALVKGMCSSLQHGGPDDGGVYQNTNSSLVLGHRRLSIIDTTAGGHQPMIYEQGRYVISYNGELYNYRELKSVLAAAGVSFKTQSDTEVVLAAYATWGIACLERFSRKSICTPDGWSAQKR